MTNHISFIDCYIETPVHNCVNDFILKNQRLSTYHMVAHFGLRSLFEEETPKAYVILGSASHLSQNLSWHKELAVFIDEKLKSGIPVLGICFGHQLMADYYGCEVGFIQKDEKTFKEARDISIRANCYGIQESSVLKMAFCHSQIVKTLSSDFTSIASSDRFDNEIIQHNSLPFTGIQSHPEASLNFLKNEAEETEENCLKAKRDGDLFLNYFNSSLK